MSVLTLVGSGPVIFEPSARRKRRNMEVWSLERWISRGIFSISKAMGLTLLH